VELNIRQSRLFPVSEESVGTLFYHPLATCLKWTEWWMILFILKTNRIGLMP
jgi:hypothetical protein